MTRTIDNFVLYSIFTSIIFTLVALQFLFPSSYIFPLDRKLTGLLGAVLMAAISSAFPIHTGTTGSSTSSDDDGHKTFLEYVDIQVQIPLNR